MIGRINNKYYQINTQIINFENINNLYRTKMQINY